MSSMKVFVVDDVENDSHILCVSRETVIKLVSDIIVGYDRDDLEAYADAQGHAPPENIESCLAQFSAGEIDGLLISDVDVVTICTVQLEEVLP